MQFAFTFSTAVSALGRKKSRTVLTMLGIIIGIASVIIIMAVGASAQELILSQIKSVGTNLIAILPGEPNEEGPPASALGITLTTLKLDDIEALAKPSNAPHVAAAAAYVRGVVPAVWRDRDVDVNIMGTLASYTAVEDAVVARGRFFTDEEDHNLSRVAVLGSQAATDIFGANNPLGQQFKLKKHTFTVIGVMEERGTQGFQNQDNVVIIPLVTAQKLLLAIDHVSFARVRVDDEAFIEETKRDIAATLRERHDIKRGLPDDFDIRDQRQGIEVLTSVTDALKLFLAAIAAISLIVGGIGIMNVMLVSVLERTREIGLRKALGATNQLVLGQFLVEAVILTFTGSLIGIAAGSLIALLVSLVARQLGYDWQFLLPLESIIVSCAVAIAIGLIFGVYPARRAARLDPIEALRYE